MFYGDTRKLQIKLCYCELHLCASGPLASDVFFSCSFQACSHMRSQNGYLLVLSAEVAPLWRAAVWYPMSGGSWWNPSPTVGKGVCPSLPLDRDFFFQPSPHQTGVQVSRKEVSQNKQTTNNNICFLFKKQETSKHQNVYYFCGASSHNYCFKLTAVQFFSLLRLSIGSGGLRNHITLPSTCQGRWPKLQPPLRSCPSPLWPPILVRMEKKEVSLLKREPADFLTASVKEEVKTKRRYDKIRIDLKECSWGKSTLLETFQVIIQKVHICASVLVWTKMDSFTQLLCNISLFWLRCPKSWFCFLKVECLYCFFRN